MSTIYLDMPLDKLYNSAMKKLLSPVGFGLAAFFIVIYSPGTVRAQCAGIDSPDLTTHVSNQIDNRLSGLDPSTALSIYNNRSNLPWTRNLNSWTQKGSPLDFTGVAGWNDDLAHHFGNGFYGGATLISPRHYVTAAHFYLANGTKISFLDASGNVVIRTVLNSVGVAGTDINIGLLDSDVPSSITYYPLISSTALQNMTVQTIAETIDVPIVVFNQNGQALIRSMGGIGTEISNFTYNAGPRAPFSRDLISGDSGQPGFIIINGKPVLLFANHGAVNGANLGNYINEINQAIDSMGTSGGYHVTQYSASCFTQSAPLVPSTMTSAPSNFKSCLAGSGNDQARLTWTAPADIPDKYVVSVDYGAFMNVPGSALSYVHSPITPGSNHSYALAAYRAGFNSSQTQRTDLSAAQSCNAAQSTPTPTPVSTLTENYQRGYLSDP
jgi:hypothetical protein